MAKQLKAKNDPNGADRDEHELVAMARALAEIASEHGLSELIVDAKDAKLTIRRGVVAGSAPIAVHAPVALPAYAPAPAFGHAPQAASAPAPVEEKGHVVTSPFVGTFYRKPNPDSPNYVSMGDKIDKGQVLCIVEAMKLMNEIEADASGTITGILVEDGASVEYGQPLFRIA